MSDATAENKWRLPFSFVLFLHLIPENSPLFFHNIFRPTIVFCCAIPTDCEWFKLVVRISFIPARLKIAFSHIFALKLGILPLQFIHIAAKSDRFWQWHLDCFQTWFSFQFHTFQLENKGYGKIAIMSIILHLFHQTHIHICINAFQKFNISCHALGKVYLCSIYHSRNTSHSNDMRTFNHSIHSNLLIP